MFSSGFINNSKTKILQLKYKITRPASNPYITGDGFRKLALHCFDERNKTIEPAQIKEEDILFVGTHFLKLFFTIIHPKIKVKYKLITHNSDALVDAELISMMNDRIEVWSAQNNIISNPKIIPIPIGLENLHHYHRGRTDYFNELRKRQSHLRKNKVLFGFNIKTNLPERMQAYNFAIKYKHSDKLPQNLDQLQYLQILLNYKFILSPPGNGIDTHRTWESMYLGVVPIVKDSVAMRSFEDIGLPLWVIKNWDELLSVDEPFLETKYEQLKDRFNSPALFMEFWMKRILKGV